MSRKVQVFGHRGSPETHVENTLASFVAADRARADFVELDVRLSADRVPVVYHDRALSGRLCRDPRGDLLKRPIPVHRLTANEIQRYYCGTYADPRFPQQQLLPSAPVPLLEDVLRWHCDDAARMHLDIEIKIDSPEESRDIAENFANTLLELLQRYEMRQAVMVHSSDRNVMEHVRKLDSELPAGILFDDEDDFVSRAIASGFRIVVIHYPLLGSESVAKLHQNGIKVITYTANREDCWQNLISYEVDGIVTDCPARLVRYLKGQACVRSAPGE